MKKSIYLLMALSLTVLSCKENGGEEVTPSIEIDKTEISVSAEAATQTFSITSNTAWTVNASADWITVDPAKGEGNATVTVSIAENTIAKERTGSININSTAKRLSVAVKQAAAEIVVETKITEIKSAEDFVTVGNTMFTYEPTDVISLEADITISAPMDSLKVVFDGKGHTITLNYETTDAATTDPVYANVGVFRKVYGTVKNLKTAGSIKVKPEGSDTYHIGGIAGIGYENAVFENCENGIAVTATTGVTHHMGGVVGYIGAKITKDATNTILTTEGTASIKNCKNTAKVEMNVEGAAAASQVGGIIGHLESKGTVESCTNEGDVIYTGAGTARIGGICGYVNNLDNITFKDCINNGGVTNTATGYSGTSWAYVGGITGYYGTPSIGGKVLYENCSNTGTLSCDNASTSIRSRVGGINAHGGNSNDYAKANADGTGVHTWQYKNCSNSGAIVMSGSSSSTRSHIGGIQAYSEPGGIAIMEGCTVSGSYSSDNPATKADNNALGGLLGRGGATDCVFKDNTVAATCTLTGTATTAIAIGLFVGNNNAYTTEVTGKISGGKIVKGDTETVVTADNFSTLLFTKALGEGGTITGVTFGN